MTDSKSFNSSGFLIGLLGIAFVILKLCHVINWSWWWVTCPFWGGLALIVAGFVIYALFAIIAGSLRSKRLPPKSKWQIRLEEMQAEQRKSKQAK